MGADDSEIISISKRLARTSALWSCRNHSQPQGRKSFRHLCASMLSTGLDGRTGPNRQRTQDLRNKPGRGRVRGEQHAKDTRTREPRNQIINSGEPVDEHGSTNRLTAALDAIRQKLSTLNLYHHATRVFLGSMLRRFTTGPSYACSTTSASMDSNRPIRSITEPRQSVKSAEREVFTSYDLTPPEPPKSCTALQISESE